MNNLELTRDRAEKVLAALGLAKPDAVTIEGDSVNLAEYFVVENDGGLELYRGEYDPGTREEPPSNEPIYLALALTPSEAGFMLVCEYALSLLSLAVRVADGPESRWAD